MIKKYTTQILFIATSLILITANANLPSLKAPMISAQTLKPKITVHNRPLVRIHGKVFSVIDVQKQMDRFLKKTYPQIFDEPEALFQFYVQNWRSVLQEMIDSELMLMEAEELNYKIDKSVLREEMSDKFGANLNEQLEQLSMTKEEAETLVEQDLICRSLMWYRVWQKSMNEVTPQVVEDYYTQNVKSKPAEEAWTYQMCTIRGRDAENAEKLAESVKKIFSKEKDGMGTSLADAVNAVSSLTPSGTTIRVSDDIHLTSSQLSEENLSILKGLQPLEVSEPVKQKSRYDDQTVMRLFQLKEHEVKAPPTFEEVSNEIKEKLVAKSGEKFRSEYMTRLRKKFCCEDLIVEKMYDIRTPVFSLHHS